LWVKDVVKHNFIYLPFIKTLNIMGDINWLSIIISALIPMVMGFAWYHKALLGKPWMELTGITEEKAKEANMGMVFGVSIVMSLLLTFFLLANTNSPGQEGEFDTFGHGVIHGAFVAILVVTPAFVTNGLFEQRPWKLTLINIFYWIVTIAIMGGIIDAMNHFPNVAPN
jgi:hypothetical protein